MTDPDRRSLHRLPLYNVGLTGGIASGKSTVAHLFADCGARIVDTDVIARQVVQPGQEALNEIRTVFGDGVIGHDGGLDRRALRQIVFDNDHKRHQLEAILHPRIGAETRRQAEQAVSDAANSAPYQIIVVPLLVGSPLLGFVDRVLVVDCDEETQIERLLARDAETEQQARRMLAAQASRQERLAIADDIISNDNGKDALAETAVRVRQLDAIYRLICAPPPGGAE